MAVRDERLFPGRSIWKGRTCGHYRQHFADGIPGRKDSFGHGGGVGVAQGKLAFFARRR